MSGFRSTCWGWFLGIVSLCASVLGANCASAEITQDGTLPNNSRVTTQDNIRTIEGGTQAGSNLFHSFKEFSVPNGDTAFFNNAADIQNIISRVTGGSVSNIDGLIRANSANLFLINPSGIVFGKDASLNIGGSFLASTASSLKFADGTEFSATVPQTTPLLTVSVPVGLQYGGNAGKIQVQGAIALQPGKTLTLIGGDVSLDGGFLQVPGGQVNLGGLSGAGTVGLLIDGNNLSLSFPEDIERADVALTNAAKVDVTDRGAGKLAFTAGNIDILGGSKVWAGIGQGLTAVSSPSGDVTLNATGVVTISELSQVSNVVNTGAIGNAGNINIQAGEISVVNYNSDAALDSSNSGQGNGGNVLLEANGSISLIGQSVNATDRVISTRSRVGGLDAGNISLKANGSIYLDNAYLDAIGRSSTGNGGNILLQGNESVSLTNNSLLIAETYDKGNSGNITVQSQGSVSLQTSMISTNVGSTDSESPFPQAKGGNIQISGRSVSVIDGALVTARSYNGASGNIQVDATDFVEISGKPTFTYPPDGTRLQEITSPAGTSLPETTYRTTLTTTSEEKATGKAGDINITAGSVRISDGGRFLTTANGKGDAGDINIKAGDISVVNYNSAPALDSSNSGQGNGGNVLLEANGSISLIGQSVIDSDKVISSRSRVGGLDAGNISLKANGSISLSNAYLDAISRSSTGNGGDISLQGNESVSLANNSLLVTATYYDKGNSGDITVQSQGPVSLQASIISTNVGTDSQSPSPEGKAGNIEISGRSVSVIDGALVTNRPFRGEPGTIKVNAQEFVELRGITPHPLSSGNRLQNLGLYSQLTTSGEEKASSSSGDISITTDTLRLSDGANIRADSRSNSKGGSITVNAKVVELNSGGQLFTTAFGKGDAGNITLNVTDRIAINGSNPNFDTVNEVTKMNQGRTEFSPGPIDPASGIFANISETSTGRGGDLNIKTGELIVREGAQVTVSSEGRGNAGNLDIKANFIRLENQGKLTASTAAGTGGNITLRDLKLLLMRDRSLISAEALNDANGGNITINAKDGFIVADKRENSDIVADAFRGNGGNINITASGIYGLENRSGQPREDSTISEINASSEFGVDGTVEIDTLEIDPSRGLINLPAVPVDTQVAQSCTAGGAIAQSSFIITGRGGLPPNPGDTLSTDAVEVNLITVNPSSNNRSSQTVTSKTTTATPERIVEATGWMRNEKGEVILIASPTTTPHSPWFNQPHCKAS